jgi:CBS domain-containing protein
MRIRDILQIKGGEVITVAPDVPVQEATRVLVQHNIGALVVAAADGTPCGIMTERDVLRTAAQDVQRLAAARVRDLMTAELVTATPEADIDAVMRLMTERRIRHLPVTDGGILCGIISIGDVVSALQRSAEAENRHLHAYIAGAPL